MFTSISTRSGSLIVDGHVLQTDQPSPSTVLYNLACALARSGDTKRSLAVLSQAVHAGFHDAHLLLTDADLAPIRARPEFKALVAKLEE